MLPFSVCAAGSDVETVKEYRGTVLMHAEDASHGSHLDIYIIYRHGFTTDRSNYNFSNITKSI